MYAKKLDEFLKFSFHQIILFAYYHIYGFSWYSFLFAVLGLFFMASTAYSSYRLFFAMLLLTDILIIKSFLLPSFLSHFPIFLSDS